MTDFSLMSIFSYNAAGEAVCTYVEISQLRFWISLICGIWYLFIIAVQSLGLLQLYRHYSFIPKPAVSPTLELDDVPHVTVLRPVKGLEPYLYECLVATFRQNYPREKLSIYFCIATKKDPAFPLLQRLLTEFSRLDARIYIEEDDENLNRCTSEKSILGPNPKIRNLSRAYREAKSDIIWILDCNVWVGTGVAGRMVDKLCGFRTNGSRAAPYKLVHQLPIVVNRVDPDLNDEACSSYNMSENKFNGISSNFNTNHSSFTGLQRVSVTDINFRNFGARLEEMFMSSSHAKFYTAINTVSVAPCIVGKSNMFRKSHLDYVTRDKFCYPGLDYFSENICEDHLIGEALWSQKVREEGPGRKFLKHGIVFGDLAIQPMIEMSIPEYIGRRVRWLRVRKWTVPLATLVEPGVEPFLCSAYGAFALTSLPWFRKSFCMPHSWSSFLLAWILSLCIWMFIDKLSFSKLHSGTSIELDANTPSFARPTVNQKHRGIIQWITAWIGRELLTLPIWVWACLCGTTVMWRGKQFRIKLDMTVSEVIQNNDKAATTVKTSISSSKTRKD